MKLNFPVKKIKDVSVQTNFLYLENFFDGRKLRLTNQTSFPKNPIKGTIILKEDHLYIYIDTWKQII